MAQLLYDKSITRQRIDDSRLLQYSNENRTQGFFNDVTLRVGNECFPANRMVLSCYSRFFEEMFISKEQTDFSVKIQDIDGKSLRNLIEFIYTGKILVDNHNVMSLLSGADILRLEDVKKFCFDFLESVISSESCFYILAAANLYDRDSLKVKVYKHITDNFDEISQSIEFKNLSKHDLVACVTNLSRDRIQEMLLYEAIITWTKHDEENRKKDFPELLQLLKLDSLPSEYLLYVVSEENIIKEYASCSNLVMNTLSKLLKDKKVKESGSKILSLGGTKSPSKVTEVYNLFGEESKVYPDLPMKLDCHAAVNLQNSVYCIGGTIVGDNVIVTDRVWQMMLNKDHLRWDEIASMNEKRYLMGAAIFDDIMVVAGGYGSKPALTSTEIYIKQINEWKQISSLKHARSGHALATCDGCLYAVGGWDGNHYLASVERLSGLKESWKYVEPMQTARRWLAVATCKDVIYAIGGRSGSDESTRLKSVEKYDPDERKWVYVSDMNIERAAHAVCVLKDKIYVVGGYNVKGKSVKEIECYDPARDVWSIVGKTNSELFNNPLVVM